MATDTVFVIEPVGYRHAFRSWSGPVGRHMLKVTTKELVLAKRSAPSPGSAPRNRTGINYSTGVLEASIIFKLGYWGADLEGSVGALAPHSAMVHGGTSRHVILPRRPGGHLKFFWAKKGRVVVLPHVNHPGAAPIPFLAENLREAIR